MYSNQVQAVVRHRRLHGVLPLPGKCTSYVFCLLCAEMGYKCRFGLSSETAMQPQGRHFNYRLLFHVALSLIHRIMGDKDLAPRFQREVIDVWNRSVVLTQISRIISHSRVQQYHFLQTPRL